MTSVSFKKGDVVKVLAGDDRGKTGKVLRVLPKDEKVVVEGVKLAKKHQRARKRNEKGQIIEKAMPTHISNVQHVDTRVKKPSAKKK